MTSVAAFQGAIAIPLGMRPILIGLPGVLVAAAEPVDEASVLAMTFRAWLTIAIAGGMTKVVRPIARRSTQVIPHTRMERSS